MIDALDEAADPPHLAGRLLRPLIEHGGATSSCYWDPPTRARPPGPGLGRRCEEIDLDTPRYADPHSLAALVRRILREGDGTQTRCRRSLAARRRSWRQPPRRSPSAAGRSFFVARILAATQASQPALPDPTDPRWRDSLPGQAGPAMRQDLETRLPGRAELAIDMLRPLAYAQGPGLPWEDIWPLLANALTPNARYTNDDLIWLTDRAGSYIVESGTIEDRSLYRLYHRSLVEHLRDGRDETADQYAIATALSRHVPLKDNGRPNWAAAHPYIRMHLPAHAVTGQMIDHLAQDPGFLLAADPAGLLDALHRTASRAARTAADAYYRARPSLRRSPPVEQAAYLALAARYRRAHNLADRITADGLDAIWRPLWACWQLERRHDVIAGHGKWVRDVTVAELNGRPVAISGSGDETVRVWDLATGTPIGRPLTGHSGPVNAVAATELNGRPVAISGSDDKTVRVWDLATGTPIGRPLTGHSGHVNAVAATELNGRPVAISGSDDKTVRVWDLATGTVIGRPLTGHSGQVNAVAVAKLNSHPVIVGAMHNAVQVWDLATGAPIGEPLTGQSTLVTAVAVADLDGRSVAISGSIDGTIQVWNLASGTLIGSPLTGHSGSVNAVAAAELKGRPVIISGSDDKTVRIWDLATATPIGDPLLGHTDWVRSVTTANLGSRPVIISGSSDKTVRVWDLATGIPSGHPFTGHTVEVNAVTAAELDGRPVIVSGSSDATVRVWDLATGSPIGDPLLGHTDW